MDSETRQLLAWYVNGTLTGVGRDRVEAALQNDSGSASLLDWERSLQDAVRSDPALEVAPDRGLQQTMQRIRAENPQGARPRPAAGGWFAKLGGKFQWSPILAFACTLIAVQAVVIAQMWSARDESGEYSDWRAVSARHAPANSFIRVALRPESTAGEINTLLRSVRAEIVSGPTQLGDYYLLIEKSRANETLEVLQKSANVESAEIVSRLPTRL